MKQKGGQTMICYKCSNSIKPDARFCSKCGAPQSAPTSNAPSQPQPTPSTMKLYMDAKGLTLLNYKFDIRDADGNIRYRAATVTESMITYNARIYHPDDSEAMIIHQQKKMTMVAMNFDILSADGKLVSEVIQKVHFTSSEFQLPQLGLVATGDFLSLNFTFKRGNQVIASVKKKLLAWGDCYELEFCDPNLEQALLAAIMVIQIVIAASRRRRRR